MSGKTDIEWTDSTWNPVTGCTKVSAGCDHCYAETFAERWRGTPGHYFERGFDVQLRPDKLDWPLRKRKPQRIFVNSMSDLFHDQVPDEYIARVWAVMALAPRHTFQVLTKRHGRMRSLLGSEFFAGLVYMALNAILAQYNPPAPVAPDTIMSALDNFARGHFMVLPNVWLGVSAEDAKWAKIRGDALRETPAAVRFFSCEPLLGAIDDLDLTGIDWVIVGGESGRGARPMCSDWATSLLQQCLTARVPYLFKQWGNWSSNIDLIEQLGYDRLKPHALVNQADGSVVKSASETRNGSWTYVWNVGKKKAGRQLLGRTWDQYPVVAS